MGPYCCLSSGSYVSALLSSQTKALECLGKTAIFHNGDVLGGVILFLI